MTERQAKDKTILILLRWRWESITKNWHTEPRMQRPQPNLTVNNLLAAEALVHEGMNSRGRRRLLRSLERIRS